jgi:hypothetical protein
MRLRPVGLRIEVGVVQVTIAFLIRKESSSGRLDSSSTPVYSYDLPPETRRTKTE